MAGSVTSTGFEELRQAIQQFPATVTAKLRAVAWQTSRDVKEIAKRLAPRDEGPRRGNNPHLADSIVIDEHADRKEFAVYPNTPWNPNLGLFIERGTVKMRARPFMRPAGDQVNPSYQSEMTAAATQAADKAFV